MTESQMGADEMERLPTPCLCMLYRRQAQHEATDVPQPPFTAEHLGELELAELIVTGGPLLYKLSSMLGSCERNKNNVSNSQQKSHLKHQRLSPFPPPPLLPQPLPRSR